MRSAIIDANVRRIFRCGRQAGVFEIIHADSESATNLIRPMRVRDDRKFVRVRFINDRFRFLQRHLILVDHLDDVDAGVGDFLHLGARIGRAFHAPAIKFFARIRLVLDEMARRRKASVPEFRRD